MGPREIKERRKAQGEMSVVSGPLRIKHEKGVRRQETEGWRLEAEGRLRIEGL